MPAGVTEIRSLPGTASDTGCGDPTASYRPTGAQTGGTLAMIRARGRLIAGVDQNTYKFGYRNPVTGRLEGFDVDIARAVAKAIFGNPDAIQFRVVDPGTRIAAVQDHDVDITVDTMTVNCARWKDVAFSTVYYQAGQRVLVPKSSTATSIASLGGKKVCAAAGSTSIQNIVNAAGTGVRSPSGSRCRTGPTAS
ncbi:transporter substrate-binding domain-containing protein [Tsukamurella soli]|uniref:transporter substrate-binding domain-containing protein n=1 Tax=Tsukamurella soli TaxID=644556 RepID=UPI00361104E7